MNEQERRTLMAFRVYKFIPAKTPKVPKNATPMQEMMHEFFNPKRPPLLKLPRKWRTRKGIRRFLRQPRTRAWAKKVIAAGGINAGLNSLFRENSFITALLWGPRKGWRNYTACANCCKEVGPYHYCERCRQLGDVEDWCECRDCGKRMPRLERGKHTEHARIN